jgi:hypothetical protein
MNGSATTAARKVEEVTDFQRAYTEAFNSADVEQRLALYEVSAALVPEPGRTS